MAFFVPVVYALGGMLIRVAAKKVAEKLAKEGAKKLTKKAAEELMNQYIDIRRSEGRRAFIDGPHFELV